jgi:signal transduction histidine kinase/CheY-like chemotaxis protein
MAERPQSLVLDDLPIAVARLDSAHVVLEANRAFRALAHGGDPVGAKLADVLDAAGAVAEDCGFGRVFRIRAEGEALSLRLSIHGRGADHLALFTDVTEARARAERNAPAADVQAQLLHDAEIGAWRYDPDIDTYYFPTALSLGHGDVGRPLPCAMLRRLQHPDDRAVDDAIRARITREGGTAEAEIRYLTAAGEWTHLKVYYRAGPRLASGLHEMHGVSQNVTSLARARDEARAAAKRLSLALEASHAGVFEADFEAGALWLSPESRELLGTSEERLSDPLGVFHPDDRAAVRTLAEGAAGNGGAVDARLLRPAGETWVRVCLEIERGADGAPRRGVGLVIDIDEAKRQEFALREARRTAEDATAAKSDFLASVSHEIRTPMNGVVGVLNLLKRERLSAEGAQLLDEALGCAEMLGGLINDVLDFSKIEAGKFTLNPAPSDPVAILEGVVHLLSPQAEAKGLDLGIQAAGDLGWIEVDPVRLRQCLFNIVGNAVKFTEEGGVVVRMRRAGSPQAPRLRVEVEDTGVGVPDAARTRLFERFEQAEAGTTRRFGGTGLGLAITRQLVRLMGGELDFESRLGEGSTFWFEIVAPPAAPAEGGGGLDLSAAPLAGLRVLVVDDNRVNRLVGVRSVEALGASAEAVEGGAEAVEAVKNGGFDLVLMDVNMPGVDGLEATRRIRRLRPPAGQVPILALTADVMRQQRQTYLAAGMDGMAPKPFSPAELLAEIARVAGAEADGGGAGSGCVA